RLHCESGAKVVQAGAVAGRGAAQPDLAGQPVERPPDISDINATSGARYEQVGDGPAGEVAIAAPDVIAQDLPGRGMQRDQSRLAELRLPDGEHSFGPVDI